MGWVGCEKPDPSTVRQPPLRTPGVRIEGWQTHRGLNNGVSLRKLLFLSQVEILKITAHEPHSCCEGVQKVFLCCVFLALIFFFQHNHLKLKIQMNTHSIINARIYLHRQIHLYGHKNKKLRRKDVRFGKRIVFVRPGGSESSSKCSAMHPLRQYIPTKDLFQRTLVLYSNSNSPFGRNWQLNLHLENLRLHWTLTLDIHTPVARWGVFRRLVRELKPRRTNRSIRQSTVETWVTHLDPLRLPFDCKHKQKMIIQNRPGGDPAAAEVLRRTLAHGVHRLEAGMGGGASLGYA